MTSNLFRKFHAHLAQFEFDLGRGTHHYTFDDRPGEKSLLTSIYKIKKEYVRMGPFILDSSVKNMGLEYQVMQRLLACFPSTTRIEVHTPLDEQKIFWKEAGLDVTHMGARGTKPDESKGDNDFDRWIQEPKQHPFPHPNTDQMGFGNTYYEIKLTQRNWEHAYSHPREPHDPIIVPDGGIDYNTDVYIGFGREYEGFTYEGRRYCDDIHRTNTFQLDGITKSTVEQSEFFCFILRPWMETQSIVAYKRLRRELLVWRRQQKQERSEPYGPSS